MKIRQSLSTALKEHPIATRLLLIAELILLLICVVGAIRPREAITVPASEISAPLSLDAGTYRICIHYTTDMAAQACYRVTATVPGGKLLADTVNLYEGESCSDSTIWLTAKTSDLTVTFSSVEGGNLIPGDMTIIPTGGFWRIRLFWVLLLCLGINGFGLLWIYNRYYGISDEGKYVLLGFTGIVLFSSAPMFVDFIPEQDDILFHLTRIEGIARGLKAGIFPIRIQPGCMGGQGYGASLFYGDTLLYIPALLRLWGFPIQTAYQIFMVLNNLLSAWIFYYCGRKMTGDRMIAMVGAMIYNGCEYHLVNLYARGAMGEALAMTFLPLVIYGLYRILDGDTREKEYSYAFLLPAIGYAGIIQSHTLSVEMTGLLTILLCIVCLKRTLQKPRFLQLLKTAGTALLLSAWYILPFVDELSSGTYLVMTIKDRAIQEWGIYLSHLLLPLIHTGRTAQFFANGLRDSTPLSVGLTLMLILAGFITYSVLNSGKIWREKKAEKVLLLFAVLCLILSTSLFPWNRIQSFALQHPKIAFVATMISSIQFPWRFLSIASPILVMLGVLLLKHKKDGERSSGTNKVGILSYRNFALCLLATMIFTSGIFFADLVENRGILKLYDDDSMGDGVIMGGEYLPEGTDPTRLTHGNCYAEGGLILEDFHQDALTVQASVSGEEGTLTVPLLYYKGYRARTAEGEVLSVYAGENNQAAVRLPKTLMDSGNGRAEVTVTFQSPWYWRVAELISLLTVLGLIFYAWNCVRPCKIRLHTENASYNEHVKGCPNQ
ncbi:MAG: hypothetical protein K6A92_03370 [Lachnospiraceae bacterium]|nr:hypothetical protein [Lachnospiraceae bacterium]